MGFCLQMGHALSVEYVDGGPFCATYPYDCPRDRNTLLLAAAQHDTALADQRVQPVREVAHKLVHVRFPHDPLEGAFGDFLAHVQPVQDVFPYAAAEQYRFLVEDRAL